MSEWENRGLQGISVMLGILLNTSFRIKVFKVTLKGIWFIYIWYSFYSFKEI